MANRKTYMAQCTGGHVWEIPHDSELEAKAIKREADGYLDAVLISCHDCNQCHEEAQQRADADRAKYGYSLQELIEL